MSGFFAHVDWAEIVQATLDTLVMLGGSLLLTLLIGLPLGVLLFLTGPGGPWRSRVTNGALALLVNLLRSVPFIILLIVMIPLTVLLVGTSLGVAGAIPPLVVGAAPFFARLVETWLREVDHNTIEAVQAMGATTRNPVFRALLPEALPGIVAEGTHLVAIAGVHVEPFGAYSRRWKSLEALPTGATVAIPNEPSNSGRALQLLAREHLITLRDPNNATATPKDIARNSRGLVFRELEAATLPRVLDQVDLALINTNYALDAKLNPTRDALAIEDKNSPYVNFVVGPESAKADPRVQKLVAALRSPEVKAFIAKKYDGAVIPAF